MNSIPKCFKHSIFVDESQDALEIEIKYLASTKVTIYLLNPLKFESSDFLGPITKDFHST